MSPDRREGQPPADVELLFSMPDIKLPHYLKDLDKHLQSLGTIIYENQELYVTKTELTHDDLPTGTLYVHGKKDGLPYYGAEYIREGDNFYVDGARFWDFTLIQFPHGREKPSFGNNPILSCRETILYQPSADDPEGIITQRISSLDPLNKNELVRGRGSTFFDLSEIPFKGNAVASAIVKKTHEQMARIPNLRITLAEEY